MLRFRTLSVGFVAALTLVSAFRLLPQAHAVTVFQTNGGNWTVPGNWNNGLPDAGDDGEIPSGFVALGDGLLTGTNVTVQNGGTLRVTSANQIIDGDLISDGFINVQNGGRMEYTINSGTASDHDTVNLFDGASFGRNVTFTSPINSVIYADLNIVGTGAEVYIQGAHPGGRSMDIIGSISGDSTTTLVGTNLGTNNGTLAIISATDNPFAGKTIIRSSNGTTRGVLAVQGENPLGTGAAGVVEVQNLGTFRLRNNTGVTGTGQIQVQAGGRIEIDGNSSGNTIQLMDGSQLGRLENTLTTNTSTDAINIDSNATVTFTGITNSRRIIMSGPITGDSSTIINVVNNGAFDGYFQIQSASGNAFDGQIIVTGTSDADRGRLAAGGTNPLGTGLANHVVIGNYGLIEFMTNTGLQSGTDIVEVQSNGRVEFSGTSSGNRIQMADNTTIARPSTSPTTAISNDIIEFANNANITLYGSYTDPREYVLQGPLSGSNLTITMQNEGSILDGELRINSATGNALSGQMIVKGSSAADLGSLGLQGTSPLGTMNVEIQEFGNVITRIGPWMISRKSPCSAVVRSDSVMVAAPPGPIRPCVAMAWFVPKPTPAPNTRTAPPNP